MADIRSESGLYICFFVCYDGGTGNKTAEDRERINGENETERIWRLY